MAATMVYTCHQISKTGHQAHSTIICLSVSVNKQTSEVTDFKLHSVSTHTAKMGPKSQRSNSEDYKVLWHCWLGIRKSIWPVKSLRWGAGVVWCSYLSAASCKWSAYGPADATAAHHLLLH